MRLCEYRCRCPGTAALTWTHMHLRDEHPFPQLLRNPWRNWENSFLNSIKTECNVYLVHHQGGLLVSTLLRHKCNKILERVRLRRETDHPGLLVQLRWRKHFHCVAICTKSHVIKPKKNPNKPETTGGAKHPDLVWRKSLCWWGSTEEPGASYAVLVTPLPAKEASASQRGPCFFPSFPL